MISQEELRSIFNYCAETGVFTWRIQPALKKKPGIGDVAGSVHKKTGYVMLKIKSKSYRAHRLAWLYINGEYPKNHIDHINGICSDNRFINLRECTHQENQQNRKSSKRSSSKYIGVDWCKLSKKWRSQITLNGKNKYLGLFESEELAHEAYCEAKKQLHKFNPIPRI